MPVPGLTEWETLSPGLDPDNDQEALVAPPGIENMNSSHAPLKQDPKPVCTYWATLDISPGKTFLSSCKACTSRKLYTSQYNAAVHLRRIHFRPPKIKWSDHKKKSHPPMDVLRNWMQKISKPVEPLRDPLGADSSSSRGEESGLKKSTEPIPTSRNDMVVVSQNDNKNRFPILEQVGVFSPASLDSPNPRLSLQDSGDLNPKPTDDTKFEPARISAPSVVAFTDSGYGASVGGTSKLGTTSNDLGTALGHPDSVAGEPPMVHEADAAIISSLDDSKSIYSTNSSIAAATKDGYVDALAGELSKALNEYRAYPYNFDNMSQALPSLLKTFALSIGHNAPSQMHRDVMAFTHRYRRDVVAALKSKMAEHTAIDRPEQDQEKMPLTELINRWNFDPVTASGLRNTPTPEETRVSTLSELDDTSGMGDASISSPTISNISEEEAGELCLEFDKQDTYSSQLPGIGAYTQLICSSPGYNILLANLHRDCLLSPSDPTVIEEIRSTIAKIIPVSPLVSRRISTESFHMTYYLDWDFLAFYRQQEYEVAPEVALENCITLTGSALNTQALTCREYVCQTWPSIGGSILSLLKRLVTEGDDPCFASLADGSKIQMAYRQPNKFSTVVIGPAYCIVEVGELLAWLGAALRSSPYPQGVIYRKPLVLDTRSTLDIQRRYHCILGFTDRGDDDTTEDLNGRCWYNLFRNPVVVEGYPIPRRQRDIPGIELPLEMMAGLVQTRYVNPFAGKLVLKGFSSMLIPTSSPDNLISWHLLYNEDGSRISYLRSTTISAITTSISQLEGSRHILGWCANMKFYAGAPDAAYTIKCSGLLRACGTSPLSSVSLSMGQILTGGSSLVVGKKDKPVHASRNGYIRKLKWLRRKFVILWDEQDKRGWLVNGTSALLHLVRASLDQDQRDEFQSVSLFRPRDIQEAKEPYKPQSALQVLLNANNLQLPIYPEGEGHTRFQDHVESFCDILERMIDYQQHEPASSNGNYSPLSGGRLEGWDFNDIISERDPIYPRFCTLDAHGTSWLGLTRSIQTVTLFGRGFGDIIKPVRGCSRWNTLPTGMSYLAACQEDVEEIMEANGNPRSTPIRLTDQVIWLIPHPLTERCQCNSANDATHSDLAQVLLPSDISHQLPTTGLNRYQQGEGAFFFGHNSDHLWLWGDTGNLSSEPTEENSPLSRKRALSPSHDSGIGKSLGSSDSSQDSETKCSIGPASTSKESSGSPISFDDSFNVLPPRKRARMQSPSSQLTPRCYTVGIVCALHIELMAVRALFDKTDEEISIANDPNYYSLGCVEDHRVVATCLPDGEYGTNPAAEVASNMKRSFPNVRFCLLVGIGGGVPSSKHDIRLGDIVVSTPSGANSGIIPYDMKKTLACGLFQSNGHLPSPPRSLRYALSKIKSDGNTSSTPPLEGYLQQIAEYSPSFRRPEAAIDQLFTAGFAHPAGHDTCDDSCPPTEQVVRAPRASTRPHIHYGTIASGNQVMKDGLERDLVAKQYDILCFEMEAAGVMHTIPSLVIRGICDYADSHKNKQWQRYAAATAAAYAKFLLSQLKKEI